MPIIPKFKTIFIHIPKCAGTSVEKVLIDYQLDRKTFKADLQKWWGNLNTTHGKYELDHSTFSYLQNNCKNYNPQFFKFCVVRNPYSRLVSEFHHCKKKGSRFVKNFTDFKSFVYFIRDNFEFILNNEEKKHHIVSHYIPQYKFVYIDGVCKMDYVMKFEKINKDWEILCKKLKINRKLIKDGTYSSGKKYNYNEYYDDELRNIVYNLYKEDFELFNYPKK